MATAFSERIKELRNEKKLSQAGFASLICTNQSTLSAYESGDRLPPYETLVIIAQQCLVSIDWLCGLSDKKSIQTKFETYSDILKLLMTLDSLDNIFISLYNKLHISNDYNEKYNTFIIDIDDKNITDFYNEWMDIKTLCSKTPSGSMLYDIWLKDALKRYNIPLQKNSSKPNEPELPFN